MGGMISVPLMAVCVMAVCGYVVVTHMGSLQKAAIVSRTAV
jgi:hypothetical protein